MRFLWTLWNIVDCPFVCVFSSHFQTGLMINCQQDNPGFPRGIPRGTLKSFLLHQLELNMRIIESQTVQFDVFKLCQKWLKPWLSWIEIKSWHASYHRFMQSKEAIKYSPARVISQMWYTRRRRHVRECVRFSSRRWDQISANLREIGDVIVAHWCHWELW